MSDWSCVVCTFINSENETTCGICASPKPSGDANTWTCQICTFINIPSTIRCDVCGEFDAELLKQQEEREKNKSLRERDRDMRAKISELHSEVTNSLNTSIRYLYRNTSACEKKLFDWKKNIYLSNLRFKKANFKLINQSTLEQLNKFKDSEVVKLKVGLENQTVHIVRKDTIQRFPGMLNAMFSGRYNNVTDEDGCYVIPYKGQHFDSLLNYLRDGKLSVPEFDLDYLLPLLEVAEYFAVENMIDDVTHMLDVQSDYNVNILNHTVTGGKATLTFFDGFDGASQYSSTLNTSGVQESYTNNGILVDQTPISHYELSYKSNASNGCLWNNNGTGTGIVVVDITGETNMVKVIRRILMYQMTDSYFCTHIKFFYHPSQNTVPTHNDNGWIPINAEWNKPPLKTSQGNPPGLNGGNTFPAAADIVIDPIITRFLKVECQNDNSLGYSSYIGIRQIKAFGCLKGEKKKRITSTQVSNCMQQ